MTDVIVLPYHQDDRVPDGSISLPEQVAVRRVLPKLPDGDQWQRLLTLYQAVAAELSGQLPDGPATVVSGDCLTALGVLAGAQQAGLDPGIVWLDAHGDVHTMASSTSGYLGGMALRMVVGGDPERLTEPLGAKPLSEHRATLVDARDLDPAEAGYLAGSAIRHCRLDQLDPNDLAGGRFILHVDLDVIDAADLPGLRFPVPGGPRRETVLAAIRSLLGSGLVTALHVACPWYQATDPAQAAAREVLLAELISWP
jgi:arginase